MALKTWYSSEEEAYFTDYNDLYLFVDLESQSIENNSSTIYWRVYLGAYANGRINTSAPKNWTFTINDKTYSGTNSLEIEPGSSSTVSNTKMIASGTVVIPHDSDGNQSISFSYYQEINEEFEYYVADWSTSGSMDLPSIPREAKILSATNFTDEQNPTITYDNQAGNNLTKLEACISYTGGADDVPYREISKTGSSYTFELTEDEKNTLRLLAINSQSIQVRFYLKSTIGSTTYFHYLTRTFTVVNCNPIISNPTVKDINSSILALTGDENIIVKHASMIEYSYEVSTSKSSTLKEQSITCGTKKIVGVSQGIIDDVESGTFIFSATDSRGLTTTRTIEKNVIDYIKPTCNQRFKTELVSGTTAKITLTINGNYFNGSFGVVNNSLKLEVRFTDNNGTMTDWTELLVSPTFGTNTYTAEAVFNGFDYSKSYIFQCRAIDALYTAQTNQYTVRALPVFDWSENDFNFNVPVNISGSDLTMNGETVLRHNTDANNIILSGTGGHIYVRPGGTNDTSGETIFYSDGTVKFSGGIDLSDMMSDYVVEHGEEAMGSNGTWYWQKWNSGKAECYGKRNFGNMAITTAWGGLYRGEALDQSLPSGLFTDTPHSIHIDLINSNFGGWICKHETSAPSSSTTGSFIIVRPASATITPTDIGFSVIGRWK